MYVCIQYVYMCVYVSLFLILLNALMYVNMLAELPNL